MVKASDVIVAGRVISVGFTGPAVDATDDHGYHGNWSLARAEVERETLLKGDVSGSRLEFFFYMSTGPVSGDWNNLDPSHRYVLFLVKDGGILRSVRDFWRSSVEIGTGRPAPQLPGDDRMVERNIATILLTPGGNFEPARLAHLIDRAVPLAEEWLGWCESAKLLQDLLRYPDEGLRSAVLTQLRARAPGECAK